MYEVQMIPNNLRHEETILQIADAFNHLHNVFDDIMIKVNMRIEKNRIHISELCQRITYSTHKICNLPGTKKATQVFSNSKYPATNCHKNYRSIFSKIDETNINLKRTPINNKNLEISDHLFEKLQFFHVKFNAGARSNYTKAEEGLGSYPSGISTINELLLFNTSKNPYRNYVMSDPLQMAQHIREENELRNSGPDAAPLSISQRAALNRSVGENYFYSPDLGNVPTIDVPLDLPDLPGIADDVRYVLEYGPAIAPSVTTTPSVPDLPSVVQSPTEIIENHINVQEVKDSLPIHFILPSESKKSVVHVNADAGNQPKTICNSDASDEKSKIKTDIGKQTALPPIEDAHASLMAAIREAGGIKNAKLRNTEAKKESVSLMSGNNLMADLSAKLALRRKGISGTKMNNGSEMNSALIRISAMIPPPLPLPTNELTTEDEDWDE